MNFTKPFLTRATFMFKGGGGGGGTPAMPAPPAPPPTASAIEVTQAKLDAKRQAKAKGGINSTILAGETGESGQAGALAQASSGKTTLLGGG